MKKVLIAAIMVATAVAGNAQNKSKQKTKDKDNKKAAVLPPPRVWIPNIPDYTTTHELIVANPLLTTDSPGCRVSGFTVSLIAPGHDFYGPLYSNTWEMTEVQKGVIKTWGAYKNVTLHIQDIHLNCHETDATSPPLTYYFNMEDNK